MKNIKQKRKEKEKKKDKDKDTRQIECTILSER